MRVMILGNPNVGKTSIFNALTKQNRRVANWAGVTVEAQVAGLRHDPSIEIVDLPGFYSLALGPLTGLEMQHAVSQFLEHPPDLIMNVVDVTQLERQLFLSSQLLELGIPTLVVLTHMDRLSQHHQTLDLENLQRLLGVKVFPLYDYEHTSMASLLTCLKQCWVTKRMMPWSKNLFFNQTYVAGPELFILRRYLESTHLEAMDAVNQWYWQRLSPEVQQQIQQQQPMDFELEMLDARYQYVHDICQQVLPSYETQAQIYTAQLDRFLLHRYWGWPIFLFLLWLFFTIAVNFGGFLQQKLSAVCDGLFNGLLQQWMIQYRAPVWLKWIVVNGLGQGIATMLSFLPVMTLMNGFLSLLESSGYMARVALLFERIMRAIGLPGKAFLPLLIGFGCNVPAIMTAKIVEGSRERLLTVLLSPFMSCTARLTIYAVFVSLFFPKHGGWIVLSLYLLGIVMAILTGYILRRFWLSGRAQSLVLELPLYQVPDWRRLYRDVLLRLKLFIWRSGKLVLPFCVILGGVQAGLHSGFQGAASLQHGLWQLWIYLLHPIFAPIGLRLENWPAAVGLLTGTMAKEVVIATLNTLYNQMGHLDLSQVQLLLSEQWLQVMHEQNWTAYTSKTLMWAFVDARAAYAYLLFVLLYIPCISTLAIIRQEVGCFWQWFAFLWSLILAYSVSSLFYMIATSWDHPGASVLWVMGLLMVWWCIFQVFKYWRPMHVNGH